MYSLGQGGGDLFALGGCHSRCKLSVRRICGGRLSLGSDRQLRFCNLRLGAGVRAGEMLVHLVMQGDTDLTLIEMSLFGRPSREGSFVGVRGQSISVRRRLVVLRPTGAHGSSDFIRN